MLEHLLSTHARPVIHEVIARHTRADNIRAEDADDITSNVVLRLIQKLRLLPEAAGEAIERFDDYVATLTYNAVYDLLRRRFPQYTRLKNRLRYLLTHDVRFALWTANDVVTCGLSAWKGKAPIEADAAVTYDNASRVMRDAYAPGEAVLAVLTVLGAPVRFDALVRLLMELWRIAEDQPIDPEELSDRHPNPLAAIESRQYLLVLWDEIRRLRPMQRTALLLQMRDREGTSAVALMLLIGIASREEIADAAGLTAERFSAIQDALPLDDLAIGAMLGVTRQQVINLRKSARERLARRMASHGRPRQ